MENNLTVEMPEEDLITGIDAGNSSSWNGHSGNVKISSFIEL